VTKILVSIKEAAELLSIGKRTVHLLVSKGALPCVRIGTRKLLRVSDLLAFAKRGTNPVALRAVEAVATE
jgi:excisionase family DNA binding protein